MLEIFAGSSDSRKLIDNAVEGELIGELYMLDLAYIARLYKGHSSGRKASCSWIAGLRPHGPPLQANVVC
jgi:hypothetical protein